jgi:heme-degrading monooxygenase HmoA
MNADGVYELARLTIHEGSAEEFAVGAAASLALIRQAPGCRTAHLLNGVETPTEPVFFIHWDTVDAHLAFRAGDTFAAYRSTIQPYFAGPPTFQHYTVDVA